MGTDTTAAITALIVAILAMIIATFQVLQQYFVTGQLIRMCDGVVYGKMPGRGRRVWEFKQLRFRVVYEIPRIVLRESLWGDERKDFGGSYLGVPDLRLQEVERRREVKDALDGKGMMMRRKRGAYSAVPGEAPWVSFCRVVQYASGNDLFYELVEGDADRCPADLSVVPMQVSMRNIVTMALMAGMRCTDASFEKKSLSMEGAAGTITSSWHPILGAILRFTPKGSNGPEGLRIGNASVSPLWMSRTWDVVIVAGRPYPFRERKFYEVYEGYDWVTYSRYRSLAKVMPRPSLSKASSFSVDVRERRTSTGTETLRSRMPGVTSGIQRPSFEMRDRSNDTDDLRQDTISPSSQDGDWSFTSDENSDTASIEREGRSDRGPENLSAKTDRPLYERLGRNLRQFFQAQMVLPIVSLSNAEEYDVEHCRAPEQEKPGSVDLNESDSRQNQIRLPAFAAGLTGKKLLDGTALQNYIYEKKTGLVAPPQHEPLYLTWPTSREELDQDESSSTRNIEHPCSWQDAYMAKQRERSSLYLDRWRNIVRSRSRLREGLNLDDEWEILSRFSQFARSNAGDTTRPTTSSTLEGRSRSRKSFLSRRSDRGTDAFRNFEQRGRTRRRSLDHLLQLGRSSVTPRRRSRRRTSTQSLRNTGVTHQDKPILAIEGPKKEQEASQSGINENCDATEPIMTSKNESAKGPIPSSSDPPLHHSNFLESSKLPAYLKPITMSDSSILDAGDSSNLQLPSTSSREPESPIAQNAPVPNSDDERVRVPRRGILKPPRERFPEDESATGEDVPPAKVEKRTKDIPAGARLTKISRRLVNPEALEAKGERYEARDDFVVVLRVLIKEEIEELADMTREIRDLRELERARQEADEEQDSDNESSHSKRRTSHRRPGSSQASIRSPNQGENSSGRWSKESNLGSTLDIPFTSSPHRMSSDDDEDSDTSRSRRRRHHTSLATSSNRWRRRRDTDERSYYDRPKASPPPDTRFEVVRNMAGFRPDDKSRESYPPRSNFEPTDNLPHDIFEGKGQVNWSWICQADVIPGYFATPWKNHFSESVCIGAISTMLEVLQYFTTPTSLRFVDRQPYCEAWIKQGLCTHPSYAINAMGGIIVSGKYRRARFSCILATTIPPIELLRSYEHQVSRSHASKDSTSTVLSKLAELASLDSWLAFCGRLPEICNGRNDLLRRMPAFIQKIMTDYDYEFSTLDRTATEGGLQVIQEMAELVLEDWEREGLSEAEMLFTAVAVLRSAKMAWGVGLGPGTGKLLEVLREDVQVYMV